MSFRPATGDAVGKVGHWQRGHWPVLLTWTWLASAALVTGAYYLAPVRLLRAYFVGFTFFATLGLGALFFVILHHLVQAHWSERACSRMAELAGVLQILPLLFLPIAFQAHQILPWLQESSSSLIPGSAKAAYLSLPFFFGRAALYLTTWWALSHFFRSAYASSEVAQRNEAFVRMRRRSGPAMVILSISVIFASIDWWMSLQGEFRSGIFGIYVFAGAVVGSLALLALATAFGADTNFHRSNIAVEERHDIGKLIFGFVAFWAYIAFCQYLLIWYADLPNEMTFYSLRWTGAWRVATTLLILLHFVVPFVVLTSRVTKRSRFDHGAVSIVLLAAHLVDVAWIVMPPLTPNGFSFGLAEAAMLLVVLNATGTIAWRLVRVHAQQMIGELASSQMPRAESAQSAATVRAPIPLGAHVVTLVPVQWVPAIRQRSSSRTLLRPIILTATVSMVGGVALASNFETRLRAEQLQKNVVTNALQSAIALRSEIPVLNEYRWRDRQHVRLKIPIERAQVLVIAQYESLSAVKPTNTEASAKK